MSDASYGFGIVNKMSTFNENSSSENDSVRNEMSYLYGRDPSILAYGQRPFPSEESKKNLYSLLEEEQDDRDTISTVSTSTAEPILNQTIKVFLRMKPFPKNMKLTEDQRNAYTIVNSTTLMTKLHSLDNNTSCLKRIKTNEMVIRNFIFTQTFDVETSQLELFENAVKPQMADFLAGKDSIVMTYGTTNSGKTYTLQGTPESPGIIPRGIEFVFSQINPRPIPCFKPVNVCDVVYLNSQERSQEMDSKMKLLALNTGDKNLYVSTYNQMQRLLVQESPMRSNNYNDAQYSVWISFAEIYNETIYDLLRNDCQKKRPALKLGTDSRGRTFIKGLKSVCVSSGAEAYQVLMVGQYNLKVAATALNSRSSRSHCIFSIKLLKYKNELDPSYVDVSTFAFCDLAGSERLKKTLNVGERLKEAQNINTSLLVLGRCLKTIYESQSSKQKNESIGPFRESKLTRLFQRALSGKEQIALIVNVNPVPNLYTETQNVLNFSAIAKKIVVDHTKVVKRRRSHSRFSRLVSQNLKTEMDWENTDLEDDMETADIERESDIDENEEVYEELLTEIEVLKKENKELKQSILTKEMQTRQEMTDVYTKIMKTLEEDWKNRLTDMEEQQEDLRELAIEQIEDYYREKLSQMSFRKRSRSSRGDNDDEEDDRIYMQDLEAQNTKYAAKIETLKKTISDLKQSKEAAECDKTKMSFELTMAQKELKRANEKLAMAQEAICTDDASKDYISKLLEDIALKDERIKKMKVFLDEAKEEYIAISVYAQKTEDRNKELEEQLAVNVEHINDLKVQLNQAMENSSAQSKVIDGLEEELEQQLKKLIETEEKIRNLEEQLLDANSLNNKTDTEIKVQSTDDENKEILQSLKSRLESAEEENRKLQEKLSLKVDENESLKNNLEIAQSQLEKVTEDIENLSIHKPKQKKYFTLEQEVQTEANKSSVQEKSEPKLANISCQTAVIENSTVETDEKWQQTSMCLNESHGKDEIIHEKDMIIKANKEVYDELKTQFEELKKSFRLCEIKKLESQECYEQKLKDLQDQMSKLSDQVAEKNEMIEKIQEEFKVVTQKLKDEKSNLEEHASAQESKCKELFDKLEAVKRREQDKDVEINTLQKDLKLLIKSNEETVQKMEGEIKNSLSELAAAKEKLISVEERNKKMDKDYRGVVHILESRMGSLENSSLEKQMETEKLKQKIEDLKKTLRESEQQLETFEKNREKNMLQYENVITSRDEEIKRLTVEIKKLQDLLQEAKENTSNVEPPKSVKKTGRKPKIVMVLDEESSENEHNENCKPNLHSKTKNKLCTPKVEKNPPVTSESNSKARRALLTPKVENVSVVELSGSETKKSNKSEVQDFTAPTRVTRRRKLLVPLDESYVDIEPSELTPSPHKPRSLRNRRNK